MADASIIFDTKLDTTGFNEGIGGVTSAADKALGVFSGIGKAAAIGLGAAATAFTGFATQSIKSFAEYEQLIGGVETLFGESASIIESYAESAYRTAGLSANQYMETVTSFSASLLQGLGGDTAKAAEIGNLAVTDMADNANKMGTDIESIQNAYQGFAKDNFTMLDNLKLGYGGTAGEMARLVNESGVLGESFTATADNVKDIPFDQLILAIHEVQTQMGITGTTSMEASETISGSWSALESSWANVLTSFASSNSEFLSTSIQSLVSSAGEFASNVMQSVTDLINNITQSLPELFTAFEPMVPLLFETLLPAVATGAVTLVTGLVQGITDNLPLMLNAGGEIIASLAQGLSESLPEIIPKSVEMVTAIVQALIDTLPLLIEAGLQLVTGLAQGLIDAIPVLVDALPEIIDSILEVLFESIPLIIQAGIDLLTALVQDLPVIIQKIVKVVPEIVQGIVTTLLDNLPALIQAGIDLLTALVQDLPEIISTILTAIPEIVSGITGTLAENTDKIISAGSQLFMALIENLPRVLVDIIKAAVSIVDDIKGAILLQVDAMADAGLDLIKGLWRGISDAKEWLCEKISGFFGGVVDSIKEFFGISSPSKLFRDDIGRMIPQGMALGIQDETDEASKAAADMSKQVYSQAVLWIKDYRNSTEYLASEEVLMWDALAEQYAQGSKQRVDAETEARKLREKILKEETKTQKAAAKEQQDIWKQHYDDAKLIIEDYRNSSDYAIQQEIEMWQALAEQYSDISKEKIEIDKNIAKLKEQQLKEQQLLEEESFNHSKNWIETNKKLQLLSLAEEIEAWERVQSRYLEGTKQRQEADIQLHELRKQQSQEHEKLLKSIADAEQRYTQAVENRTKAVFDSFVKLQDAAKIEQDNQKAYEDAANKVAKLSEEISKLDEERQKENLTTQQINEINSEYAEKQHQLSQATRDLANAQVEANKSQKQILMESLQQQVDSMEQWAKSIDSLSKRGIDEGLLKHLQNMGPSAVTNIQALDSMTQSELMQYQSTWQRGMNIARNYAVDELQGLREDTDNEIKMLNTEAENLFKTSNAGESFPDTISDNINKGVPTLLSFIRDLARHIVDTFNIELGGLADVLGITGTSLASNMAIVGHNALAGFAGGILSGNGLVKSAIGGMANAAVGWAQILLDMNSPSKVFERIGRYTVEGFAQGIDKNAALATQSIQRLIPDIATGRITPRNQAFETNSRNDMRFTIEIPLTLDGNTITRVVSEVQFRDNKFSARGHGVIL